MNLGFDSRELRGDRLIKGIAYIVFMTGKFGLSNREEDRALELMYSGQKSLPDVSAALKDEGLNYTPEQLRYLKKKSFDSLLAERRDEAVSQLLLEDMNKVVLKFEDLFQKFENLSTRLESQGEDFQQIIVLREMKSMLGMCMRRLGEWKSGIERINIKNVNVITNSDVMQAINQNMMRLFANTNPEIKDKKLIFNTPSPELLDSFYKWKFKAGRIANGSSKT